MNREYNAEIINKKRSITARLIRRKCLIEMLFLPVIKYLLCTKEQYLAKYTLSIEKCKVTELRFIDRVKTKGVDKSHNFKRRRRKKLGKS